ncbi:hypothetical protein Sros01_03320 [Streptomyces roseochromogenus]|nr:hypothetical protein Sros01_03320 [Streptomyces roseochromogenus]
MRRTLAAVALAAAVLSFSARVVSADELPLDTDRRVTDVYGHVNDAVCSMADACGPQSETDYQW